VHSGGSECASDITKRGAVVCIFELEGVVYGTFALGCKWLRLLLAYGVKAVAVHTTMVESTMLHLFNFYLFACRLDDTH
jgi:hypothetical protein